MRRATPDGFTHRLRALLYTPHNGVTIGRETGVTVQSELTAPNSESAAANWLATVPTSSCAPACYTGRARPNCGLRHEIIGLPQDRVLLVTAKGFERITATPGSSHPSAKRSE